MNNQLHFMTLKVHLLKLKLKQVKAFLYKGLILQLGQATENFCQLY